MFFADLMELILFYWADHHQIKNRQHLALSPNQQISIFSVISQFGKGFYHSGLICFLQQR